MPCKVSDSFANYKINLKLSPNSNYCRSSLGALVCVLAVLKFARNQEVRAALCEREDSPLAILPDDGVHFPISKALTISLDRSVMYADSVWYIFNLCSAVFLPISVVFHLATIFIWMHKVL